MAKQGASGITYVDETWNPVIGCSKVSAGCARCWAVGQAHCRAGNPRTPRYHGLTRKTAHGPEWTGEVRLVPEVLAAPLRWRGPKRVAVSLMGDLFRGTPEEIAAVFGVMAARPDLTFLLLTKQARRMAEWFEWLDAAQGHWLLSDATVRQRWCQDAVGRAIGTRPPLPNPAAWPLPNVHLGVSAENQAAADERIPDLLRCPAAVRWVSCEPLLGAVDLTQVRAPRDYGTYLLDAFTGSGRTHQGEPFAQLPGGIDWVVCGGESGPGARPMHPDWARSLRDQRAVAGTAFNFKQWGEWVPRGPEPHYPCVEGVPRVRLTICGCNGQSDSLAHGVPGSHTRHECDVGSDTWVQRVGKKAAGRELDGVTHDGYPEARP